MRPVGEASAPPPSAPPPSPYAPPPSPYAAPAAGVGGQPAYVPYASQPVTAQDGQPSGVDVAFGRDAIASTSRLTVLFRIILVIPHLIVLVAVSLAAYIVVIIAWFAALFIARVPQGMYDFIGWVVSYGTRVSSYVWLLTDKWPSFSETAGSYPVEVTLPGPQRLNRWAVLFRLILMIPAQIVVSVVADGLVVVAFFIWLITLFLGRVPQPAFDAAASIVRYQTRYYGFAAMLTARYPGGLFGDPQDPTESTDDSPVLSPPRINRAAKRLLIVIIVLGAIASIANAASRFSSNNNNSPDTTSVSPPFHH